MTSRWPLTHVSALAKLHSWTAACASPPVLSGSVSLSLSLCLSFCLSLRLLSPLSLSLAVSLLFKGEQIPARQPRNKEVLGDLVKGLLLGASLSAALTSGCGETLRRLCWSLPEQPLHLHPLRRKRGGGAKMLSEPFSSQ